MSVAKEQKQNGRAGKGRQHRYYKNGGGASYEDLDSAKLVSYIETIAAGGGAVRLGKTRDGGAYAIGVYGDGDQPYTDYIRESEEVERYLCELAELFRSS